MQNPRFLPQASGATITIPGNVVEVITHPAIPGRSFFGLFWIFDPIPEEFSIVVELDLQASQDAIRKLGDGKFPIHTSPQYITRRVGSTPNPQLLRVGAPVNVTVRAITWADRQYTGSAGLAMVQGVELAEGA